MYLIIDKETLKIKGTIDRGKPDKKDLEGRNEIAIKTDRMYDISNIYVEFDGKEYLVKEKEIKEPQTKVESAREKIQELERLTQKLISRIEKLEKSI